MSDKIKIQIYGYKLGKVEKSRGCGHSQGKSCGCNKGNKQDASCCSACGHGSNEDESFGDLFLDLENYIKTSDLKDKVETEFIELQKGKIGGNEDIEDLIERGFDPPITVIDGVIRYYGGISQSLIYNDVKELLQ